MDVVRESRAGDDFHLLWAARRALALMDPRSGLSLIRLEGLTPADAQEGDDRFLGVDLSEYYGGETVRDATRILVTQLKYSVRHPTRRWTAARLAAPRRSGGASVIRRLADVFGALVAEADGDSEAVARKLQIRLVSNQPAAGDLVAAIERVQVILAELPIGTQMARATRELSSKSRAVIVRLQGRSGLSSSLFADFLRVLDLRDCGAEARALQRLRLSEHVGQIVVGPHTHGLPALLELVRHQVLPEAAASPGLRRAEILAALGAPNQDDLFPAPPRFEALADPIQTPEPSRLAATVLAAQTGVLIAHGPAGIGKTTTLLLLEENLPPGSVVVSYDCFGGGDYLSPGEERHTARRALVQLANEFALRLGTEPLLMSGLASEADLWRRFRQRMEQAAVALDDGAVLVIAIDAADNAVFASGRRGERSFVVDLWDVQRPENVRILMTCRTHRRDDVRPSFDINEHALAGFDVDASTTMLRRHFATASEDDGTSFHARTAGVPRIQAYLLAMDLRTTLDALLTRSERGLTEIFDDVLRAALEERVDPSVARQQVATLFAMSRPVRLRTLAGVLGLDMESTLDIAASLQPGVRVANSSLHFPDEDFEHYLRDRVTSEELRQAHSQLADHFLTLHETDEEAAASVAEHLKEAGRIDELISLAVDHPLPMAISDGLARAQAGLRRLKLAIDACQRTDRLEDGVRLMFLAAAAARSDTSLTDVIRTRPELASRFADREAIAAVYMREESAPWLGPAHFRVASVLAWEAHSADSAREQLAQAQAWVRRWSLLEEHERRQWNLTAEDLAHGAAALYGVDGAQAAARFLARWRPPEVIESAVETLAEIIAGHLSPHDVLRDVRQVRAPSWVQAQFIAAFDALGAPVPRAWVDRVSRRLSKYPRSHRVYAHPPTWGLVFCEAGARARIPKRVTKALIARMAPALPKFAPSDYDILGDWVNPLKAVCLEAALEHRTIGVDDLLPEELRPPVDQEPGQYDPNDSKRRAFREALGPLLPIYSIRARSLVSSVDVEDVRLVAEPILRGFREQAAGRWFRTRHRFRTLAIAVVDALVLSTGDANALLQEVVDVAEVVLRRTASLRVRLARLLLRHPAYREFALRLIEGAHQELASEAYSASDRRDILLDAAAATVNVDEVVAGELFAGAIDAAQGIDDDVGLHLAVIARLATTVAPTVRGEFAKRFCERLVRSTEAVTPYVSDPGEVLPYSQVMATVANLAAPSAFALSSRWDDEEFLELDASVPIVVTEACTRGWLEPEAGIWLLRLTGDEQALVRSGITLLDLLVAKGPSARPVLVRCFTVLSDCILREAPIHERGRLAHRLGAWATQNDFAEVSSARRLDELIQFLGSMPAAGDGATYRDTSRDEHREAIARILSEERVPDISELAGEIEQLLSHYASEDEISAYLTRFVSSAGPQRRVAALERIERVAEDHPERSSVVSAVARVMREAAVRWRTSARVQRWVTESFARFVERNLPRLFGIGTTRYAGWTTELHVPFALDREHLPDLLHATAARLDELSVAQLFAVAEISARMVDPAPRADIIEWALNQVVPLDPAPAIPDIPESDVEVLASFLWSLFGHPDKRIRWRAAHVGRGLLVGARPAGLADAMVARLDSPSAGAFRAPNLEFFWLSARMWALLTLARVAAEAPQVLASHAQRLANIATDQSLPHAPSREFARRAAVRLADYVPTLLLPATIEGIALANTPTSCHATRAHRFDRDSSLSDRDIARFHFDTLDTTRYWYEPLARVFGLHTDEIVRRADRWVTEVWGRTNEECIRDPRRDRHEHEWHLTRNDHGSRPIIETLRTYLEYHAMLLVAGELIDERTPVLIEPYEDAGDSWMYWLRHHLDTDASCWLADRRSPTPLEAHCWGTVPNRATFEQGGDAAFDQLLGLISDDPKALVVAGWLHTDDEEHYVTLRVMSALVSSETATSLLRALQTASPREYQLPYAGDRDDFHRAEIDEEGFQLLGWLDDLEITWEALDDHDPTATSIADDRTVPTVEFLTASGLTGDPTGCRFRSASGEDIARVEIWSDGSGPGERHEVPRSSEGRRTWVRLDAILRYLNQRNLDLIIEAGVSMFGKSRPGRTSEDDDDHAYEESKIYLLRRDGNLESVGSRRSLGSADRRRTRTR